MLAYSSLDSDWSCLKDSLVVSESNIGFPFVHARFYEAS